MAGETGAELVSTASRMAETSAKAAESSVKAFIELLKFFRDIKRDIDDNRMRKITRNDMRLKEEKGLVAAEELVKIANLKGTTVRTLPEKMSAKQQKRFSELAEAMGIPYATFGINKNGKEIKACENRIAELENKGQYIQDTIKQIDQRRTEYCRSVEESGKPYSDRVLKDFARERDIQTQKLNDLEYLSDSEKAEYWENKEKLYGNPQKGIKGLYNEQNEACINYLEKDSGAVEYIITQINRETMQENINSKVNELEAKGQIGNLTEDEKALLEAAKKRGEVIKEQSNQAFNERSKREIYTDIHDEITRSEKTMNFKTAINHDVKNGTPKKGDCDFIFDPENPNNYVKATVVDVVKGADNKNRVVRNYEVYHEGQIQEADPIYATARKFTDEHSLSGNGKPKFIDENGNEVPAGTKGSRMYWGRMRDEMEEKAGFLNEDNTSKSLYVYRSEQEFEQYRTAYNEYVNEAQTKGKDKDGKALVEPVEKHEYDIEDRLPSLREDLKAVLDSTKEYGCNDIIENTQNVLDKHGYYYNNGALTERESGDKVTLDELKKDVDENPHHIKNTALLCAGKRIQKTSELQNVQNEYFSAIAKLNNKMNALEQNPENLSPDKLKEVEKEIQKDIKELKKLGKENNSIASELRKLDTEFTLVDIDLSKQTVELAKDNRTSDRQNIIHDSRNEKDRGVDEPKHGIDYYKQKAQENAKAKALEQGGNELVKGAKQHADLEK